MSAVYDNSPLTFQRFLGVTDADKDGRLYNDLLKFLEFCDRRPERRNWQQAGTLLTAYIGHLSARHTRPTMRHRVQAVVGYYDYLVAKGMIDANPIDSFGAGWSFNRLTMPLSHEAVNRLLAQVDSDRDRALIEFLYATAMTIPEVVQLKVSAVSFEGPTPHVNSGTRWVPLFAAAAKALETYLQSRSIRASAPLFRGHSEFLTPRQVMMLIRSSAATAGIPMPNEDTLRLTCAEHMLEGGAPLAVVKQLLGTAQTDATEPERLFSSCIAAHPRGQQVA